MTQTVAKIPPPVRPAGRARAGSLREDPVAQLITPSGRRDPYAVYRRTRERDRLVPSFLGWVSAHHDVATQVLNDHEHFSSAPLPVPDPRNDQVLQRFLVAMSGGDPTARLRGRRLVTDGAYVDVPDPLGEESLLGMDPPDHTRLRRIVNGAFTPRAVAGIREHIEEVAHDLLDRAPHREFDIIEGYAAVMPVVLICDLLGIPREDWPRVRYWGEAVASTLDIAGAAPPSAVTPALKEFRQYLRGHFERRRRTGGELVVDALLANSATEGGLTERELLATATFILTAGFETVINLIGNGVLALLEHPDQRERFTADLSLAPQLVEEVLRYDAPVQSAMRGVRAPVELAGRVLEPGVPVYLFLGGANHDPEVFAEPHRFDIGRPDARRHLSFVSGAHYCLGASLARVEGEVAFRALFERYPDLQGDGAVRRGSGLILRGATRLPVRLR